MSTWNIFGRGILRHESTLIAAQSPPLSILFRMPLAKIEELTDILISWGYIKVPRSQRFQEEFRERSELLMMSALYRLGNGNSFRQLRSMCHISISEMSLFFFDFVNAMVEMKDEYIFLPRNIAEVVVLSYRGPQPR